MRADAVITCDGAVIQHGPVNDRVYLMKPGGGPWRSALLAAEALAREHGYAKIVARVPASAMKVFSEAGYTVEATVPGLFSGREDGCFAARYPDPRRRQVTDPEVIRDVLETALSRSSGCRSCPPDRRFVVRPVVAREIPALAALYGSVFETYPFPIHDPGYLEETMKGHIRYYAAFREGRIVAASSAEIDRGSGSVEMTDFATHPSYRGMGLCTSLLERMEGDMRHERLCTAYTIARAAAYAINVTFARAGYRYGGTLFNNTNICGSFESMNVWSKRLG